MATNEATSNGDERKPNLICNRCWCPKADYHEADNRCVKSRVAAEYLDEADNPVAGKPTFYAEASIPEIMDRWDRGLFSEGQASQALGLDRIEARKAQDDWNAGKKAKEPPRPDHMAVLGAYGGHALLPDQRSVCSAKGASFLGCSWPDAAVTCPLCRNLVLSRLIATPAAAPEASKPHNGPGVAFTPRVPRWPGDADVVEALQVRLRPGYLRDRLVRGGKFDLRLALVTDNGRSEVNHRLEGLFDRVHDVSGGALLIFDAIKDPSLSDVRLEDLRHSRYAPSVEVRGMVLSINGRAHRVPFKWEVRPELILTSGNAGEGDKVFIDRGRGTDGGSGPGVGRAVKMIGHFPWPYACENRYIIAKSQAIADKVLADEPSKPWHFVVREGDSPDVGSYKVNSCIMISGDLNRTQALAEVERSFPTDHTTPPRTVKFVEMPSEACPRCGPHHDAAKPVFKDPGEIERLADFILAELNDEIGKGDPQHGESAVDVAIRLLSEVKDLRATKRRLGDEAAATERNLANAALINVGEGLDAPLEGWRKVTQFLYSRGAARGGRLDQAVLAHLEQVDSGPKQPVTAAELPGGPVWHKRRVEAANEVAAAVERVREVLPMASREHLELVRAGNLIRNTLGGSHRAAVEPAVSPYGTAPSIYDLGHGAQRDLGNRLRKLLDAPGVPKTNGLAWDELERIAERLLEPRAALLVEAVAESGSFAQGIDQAEMDTLRVIVSRLRDILGMKPGDNINRALDALRTTLAKTPAQIAEVQLAELDKVARRWEKRARTLWGIIDDVDTASDIAKGDRDLYGRLCVAAAKRRWEVFSPEIEAIPEYVSRRAAALGDGTKLRFLTDGPMREGVPPTVGAWIATTRDGRECIVEHKRLVKKGGES